MVFDAAHANLIRCVELLSPNLMVTGAYDGVVKIWDIVEKKAIITLTNNEKIMKTLKIDEKLLAVASGNNIVFWDWAGQQ